eukprot:m.121646 g.121646  ORF g.121646 m.121646 type:complete len:67 (+) comp14402_c0_seq7:1636-1836(+)
MILSVKTRLNMIMPANDTFSILRLEITGALIKMWNGLQEQCFQTLNHNFQNISELFSEFSYCSVFP